MKINGKYGTMHNMILADIGNTHFHIYDGEKIEHLSYEDALTKYTQSELCYISVKHGLSEEIAAISKWKNISKYMKIAGEYDSMGVDRKALCLSHNDGIFIDAGSAITVDVVEEGQYMGGFILLGLQAYQEGYKSISTALDVHLDKAVDLEHLHSTTKEQISYGIIASIKALIDKHSKSKMLYFTGGDGEFLSTFFDDAIYDEKLVFTGMQKAIGVMG